MSNLITEAVIIVDFISIQFGDLTVMNDYIYIVTMNRSFNRIKALNNNWAMYVKAKLIESIKISLISEKLKFNIDHVFN